MKAKIAITLASLVMISGVCLSAQGADLKAGMSTGAPDLQSAGPLAFGPQGILFVGDTQGAAIFAIDTGDTRGDRARADINVEGINVKVAQLLGTEARDVMINDMAVNPQSGQVYLSVSRGRGPDAQPVILKVDSSGQLAEVPLDNVAFSKTMLANVPGSDEVTGKGKYQESARSQAITDLAFVDGRLLAAGLSNEDFASKLRAIPFPFGDSTAGTSVEIYHGSHGAFETRSPVRTFVAYDIGGEPNLLAAYTCTPLVKFPLSDLQKGSKLRGTTIAELGNRNRPLDMVVYQKDGKDFILIANNSRGVMKLPTEGIENIEGITERVPDTAGTAYETIAGLEGIEQLDLLNADNAIVLVQRDSGTQDLRTVPLP